VKRILIALVLGSLLALSASSIAAAKVADIGHPDAAIIPDSEWAPALIEQGSRLSARLLAIDAVLYPSEVEWMVCGTDIELALEIADSDGYYLSYF
jgi:hypothetical protein